MTNIEHYFENLLFNGQDCKGEPNKKNLTKAEQAAVEECAYYVLYCLFHGRKSFLAWQTLNKTQL